MQWLLLWEPVGQRVRPWEPVAARRRSTVGTRRPLAYERILDQFDVEQSRRYRATDAGTYCNIFVWDVTRALDAELPHWVRPDGEPARVGEGRETTANTAVEWLRAHGARFGWRETDAAGAQAYANRGSPAVAAWHNPRGNGHLAMVRPGRVDERGPLLAQSGTRNARAIRAAEAFTSAWNAGAITYFVHD